MIERRIGFIGAGVMGGTLIQGMLKAGVAVATQLYASDSAPERQEAIAMTLGDNVLADNGRLVQAVDVVVLSVKPHVVPVVAQQIAGAITPSHLVISIAAGLQLGHLEGILGTDRLARVMPNTPAKLGVGASGYCTAAGATDDDVALVQEMLGAVGVAVRVEDEGLMDAVTGLSGSGPAYVYLVIEALIEGGVKAGLPKDVAVQLAAQTVLGAAGMVMETGEEPAKLRGDVTTPGGTTEQGLRVLNEAGVPRAFSDAVAAAAEKSRQLASGS